MKLLLVDSRVADIATIKRSVLPDVDVVVFDFNEETTDSLLSKINSKVYSSIGLFQENKDSSCYNFINSMSSLLKDVAIYDKNLYTWDRFIKLFTNIKIKTHFSTFDLMGCGIYSNNDWKYIIRSLETTLGVNINASTDYTGDASLGGNWILEEGNINLIGSYFSNDIKQYRHILGGNGPATYIITDVETDPDTQLVTDTGYDNSKLYGVGLNVTDLPWIGRTNGDPNGVPNSHYPSSSVKTVDSGASKVYTRWFTGSFYTGTNGKLYVAGSNIYGNLGTDDKNARPIWGEIPNDLLDLDTNGLTVDDLLTLITYTVILLSDGSLHITGINNGYGINTNKFIKFYDPSQYGGRKVKALGIGDYDGFSYIYEDGTVAYRRYTNNILHATITGLPGPVKQICLDYERIFMLFENGTVSISGPYNYSPSDSNITIGKLVQLPTGVTGFNFISNGYGRLYLIDTNGNVWYYLGDYTQGNNGFVKIYDAPSNGNDKAVEVSSFVSVNSSGQFINDSYGITVVRTESGKLWMGGKNYNGLMGNNASFPINAFYSTLQLAYTPTSESDKIISVITGVGDVILIVKNDGSIWASGLNDNYSFGIYRDNNTNYIVDLGIHAKLVSSNSLSTAIVNNLDQLYTKGQNNFGQLGLGDKIDRSTYTLAYTPPAGVKISYISMGGGYIPGGAQYGNLMVILSDGRILACGRNNLGQAGYNPVIAESTSLIEIYTPDPNDENTKAFTCCAGLLYSLFVLRNGKVYICDNDNKPPAVVYAPDLNPTDVNDKYPAIYAYAGENHCGVVTAEGSVWFRGIDNFGNNQYSNYYPYSVFGLGSLPDADFDALFPGASIVLPDNNNFSGGNYPTYTTYYKNSTPKINRVNGLKTFTRTYRPELNNGLGAVLVGCGSTWSAIIAADGSVMVTGSNESGQLGLGNNRSPINLPTSSWTKSYGPTPENPVPAKTVLCGAGVTSIIVDGSVLVTGYGGYGTLGNGGTSTVYSFTPMKNVTTFGTLTTAYALNDAQAILITAPALGPFSVPSKTYDYTDPITQTKTFTVTPPTSTSQGTFSYESSDPSIASIDPVTGVITINGNNKLGTVTIRITQQPWQNYTDTTFKETTFTVLPIPPQLGGFNAIEKWYLSRTLGVSPFTITPPTTLSAGLFSYISSNTSVATVSGNAISIIGVGTSTITATQAADGIYASDSITTTLTVNALQNPNLSSFTVDDKPYGTLPFTPILPTHLGSGAITYSISPIDKASINSTTGEITLNTTGKIGVVTVTASLEDSGIYDAATTSTTFSITPLDPELADFSVANATYGDAAFPIIPPTTLSAGAFTYTFLNVADDNENTSVLSQSGSNFEIVGAGTVRVKATQAADGIYTASSIITTMTVAKAATVYNNWDIPRRPLNYFEKTGLQLFVNDPIQVPYSNAISGTTSTGAFTYSSSDSSIASVNATTGELTLNGIGETIISITQAETANFLQGTNSTTFRVTNPAPIFGLFTIGVKRYGDAPFTVTAPTSTNPYRVFTFTSSDPSKATITRIDDEHATVTIISTGHVDIICTQAETEDFSETSITFDLNILKIVTILGDLTIPTGKNYLSSPFSILAPTSSRLGSFTFASSNPSVATIDETTGVVSITGAGTTTISCTQDETIYYYSETVSGTLSVAKAPSQITSTFSNLSVNYDSSSVTLEDPTTTSTDTNVFSYTSSNTTVASISGNVLTFVNAGTAVITCTLLESDNYQSSSTTFNVTISPINTTYPNGWSIPDLTYAPGLVITIPEPVSANPGTFTYTSSNTAIASVSGNQLSILQAGIITLTAVESTTNNFNSGTISTSLLILRATPTVGSFSVQPATFGDAPFSLTVPQTDSDGSWTFTSSDETVATINGTTITILAAGTITITAVLPITSKYATATTTTSFVINKKTPTITGFADIIKEYGDAPFTVTTIASDSNVPFSYSSSNTASVTVGVLTGLITIVGGGSSTITISQAESDNYTSASVEFLVTVGKVHPVLSPYILSEDPLRYFDAPFTAPALETTSNAPVTYSISNSSIASINSNTRLFTPNRIGTTTMTISQPENNNFYAAEITVPLTIGICFPAGTPVTTDQGIIAIEKINPKVNTIRGNKIVAITKTITPQKHIVVIEKDAIDMNMPSRNTFISMNHCVLYKGKMERARDLVSKVDGVYLKKYNGEVLYNVLLDKHSKMIVNNLIVETLDPTNIVAKLYNGNYTPEEFNKISVEISTAVAKDDKKQYEKIYKSLK